ncbi:MAG: beta-hydroxyacyl-ACP dehydratase [Candidatus Brocadiaceae bacterium]|nr:beta-hydroxyacyl-ACP dehydratase [Candidatus Brocadiaceae bacterium]
MPPKPVVDLARVDLARVVAGPEEIRRRNAQRYEMEHLDAICHIDLEEGVIVGYKDVREDEFWVRGHIPGRPLLPGVIMCEAAAQLCSYYYKEAVPADSFLGFGGLEGVKFRAEVVPGQRLILAARSRDLRPRRAVFDCQGFVDGRMVYEGTIIGMPM